MAHENVKFWLCCAQLGVLGTLSAKRRPCSNPNTQHACLPGAPRVQTSERIAAYTSSRTLIKNQPVCSFQSLGGLLKDLPGCLLP